MDKKCLILIVILLTTITILGCSLDNSIQTVSADQEESETEIYPEKSLPLEAEIRITAVGDVMVHGPQLRAQYDESTRSYGFINNFKYIKSYIEAADIAICNLETTLSGEEKNFPVTPFLTLRIP